MIKPIWLLLITPAFAVNQIPLNRPTETLQEIRNLNPYEELIREPAQFPTNIGFHGPTATGPAPFLIQTNDYPNKAKDLDNYQLPQPIETGSQSFDFNPEKDESIHHYFGTISPYHVTQEQGGWGVLEYNIPPQCKISQVHLLSRHGARYPISLGRSRLIKQTLTEENLNEKVEKFIGDLSFLNNWKYTQGVGILTAMGNQQLFNKGINTFFKYGQLYDFNANDKIVVRSTSQSRMTGSAIYFLNGFFGIDWEKFANLELIIEGRGFNNTLAPHGSCPNFSKNRNVNVTEKRRISSFIKSYLEDATNRLNTMVELRPNQSRLFDYSDVFRIQELCTYETSNLGYSKFCSLFSQKEWENYEYVHDWNSYNYMLTPNSKASKSLGIGWVEEFKARLLGQPFNTTRQTSQNTTLDTNDLFFPLNQSLYFDFTHDTTIVNILHAMGMDFETNFTGSGLRIDKVGNKDYFQVSRVIPFAAQVVFEIIDCEDEKYVHMLLNDHTIPMDKFFDGCKVKRLDGYCKFDEFVNHLDGIWEGDLSNGKIFADICYN